MPDDDALVDALGEQRAVGVLGDGVDVRRLLEDVPVLHHCRRWVRKEQWQRPARKAENAVHTTVCVRRRVCVVCVCVVRYLVALDDVGSVDGQLLVRIDGDEHLPDVCLHERTHKTRQNATNDEGDQDTRKWKKSREKRKRVVRERKREREKQATHVDEVGVVARAEGVQDSLVADVVQKDEIVHSMLKGLSVFED